MVRISWGIRYLLSEQHVDDGISEFMMRTFLVRNIQTRDCPLIIFRNFLPSLLDCNFVNILDEFGLCILQNDRIFVTILDKFFQFLKIAIDVHSLHIRTKDFRQFRDRKHIFWNCSEKNCSRCDLRGNFWSTKILLPSFLEEKKLPCKIPKGES